MNRLYLFLKTKAKDFEVFGPETLQDRVYWCLLNLFFATRYRLEAELAKAKKKAAFYKQEDQEKTEKLLNVLAVYHHTVEEHRTLRKHIL